MVCLRLLPHHVRLKHVPVPIPSCCSARQGPRLESIIVGVIVRFASLFPVGGPAIFLVLQCTTIRVVDIDYCPGVAAHLCCCYSGVSVRRSVGSVRSKSRLRRVSPGSFRLYCHSVGLLGLPTTYYRLPETSVLPLFPPIRSTRSVSQTKTSHPKYRCPPAFVAIRSTRSVSHSTLFTRYTHI